MTDTVARDSRHRHYRAPSRLAVNAAKRLGCRPGTVEQLIHGHTPVHLRLAVILEAAIDVDDQPMIAKLMAPIHAALEGHAAPEFTPALQDDTQQLDLREDEAESHHNRERSRESAREWVRSIDRAVASSQLIRQALVSRWDL